MTGIRPVLAGSMALVLWAGFFSNLQAVDIGENFSIGGILSGAYQYQWAEGDSDERGRGALAFQPELSLRPTERDEISAKFGFAAGNGLNAVTVFNLAPWAADVENDVKNINGRNRDYLLTAHYRHTFQISESNTLKLTGGIIDATDYVDQNTYANDETTQFMNAALVNGPNGFAPSYDPGGAVEWAIGSWTVNGVGMNVGENDDGNSFNFFAVQVGYTLETPFGQGNYRLIGQATNSAFLDANGDKENRLAALLSFDQAFGDNFGVWIRFGGQDDKAVIDYAYLLSGGIQIAGRFYGRGDDAIGIGYAFLGGETDIDYTQVAEIYWRLGLSDIFAVTADLQYMQDKYESGTDDIDGIIAGIRMTAQF